MSLWSEDQMMFHFREQAQFIISEVNYYQLADLPPPKEQHDKVRIRLFDLAGPNGRDPMQVEVSMKTKLKDQTKICHK
jgi:hypothetical protein